MAHALKQLIGQSEGVIIMGHKNADMDSFGAALGIFRIVFSHDKDSVIVCEKPNSTMEDAFAQAKMQGCYKFVTGKEALSYADKKKLLIIVDTHIPGLSECEELIGKVSRVIIIDHHRKMEKFIEGATLTFMEPNASSTSELVAEMMQYDDAVRKLSKLEANLMLAGIIIDTNGFSVNTGSRTYEAASWLRSRGADSTEVRKLLQNDMEDFRERARIISGAEITREGIALSLAKEPHENAQIIAAQAADELLDIKGIRASFVIAENMDGSAVISARSLGDVNVQTIMESLGGGGHLTMAAAQLAEDTPEKALKKLKRAIAKEDK
jgi:c-di-AMP phosphodiesterase-like protein